MQAQAGLNGRKVHHYDGYLVTPVSAMGSHLVMFPGETYMMAYIPGQKFTYEQLVNQGVYFFNYSNFYYSIPPAQEDSLKKQLEPPHTNLTGAEYYLYDMSNVTKDVNLTFVPLPVSSFWKKDPKHAFFLSKATFDYVQLDSLYLKIPDFSYHKWLHIFSIYKELGWIPTTTVRVPVYYITRVTTFTTKLK